MTKKPKARCGYRPPGFQSAPVFSEEQAKRLAEIAGRSHSQSIKKLHQLLNEEGEALTFVDYINRTEVSPPQQRAALEVLIDHSRRLLEGLREADLDTRRVIYSGYGWRLLGYTSGHSRAAQSPCRERSTAFR